MNGPSILDHLVLHAGYKHGDMITTMDAREAHTLREVGLRWWNMLELVKQCWQTAKDLPTGHGPIRACLLVMRQMDQDGVDVTHVQQVPLPTEMLQWPSSK